MHNKDVFISYSSGEAFDASLVKGVMEKNGISCWMAPESIPGGSDYTKEIPLAIAGCKVFLLMLSESAQKSVWVSAELENAFKNKKIIIPYAIENVSLNIEFDFLLSKSQRIQAYEEKADALERLVDCIKRILGRKETGTIPPEATPFAEVEEKVKKPEKNANPENLKKIKSVFKAEGALDVPKRNKKGE